MSLDDNGAARGAILGRVRRALGVDKLDAAQVAAREQAANAYVAAHAQGPRPSMPDDLVARFAMRAVDMSSTLTAAVALATFFWPRAAR